MNRPNVPFAPRVQRRSAGELSVHRVRWDTSTAWNAGTTPDPRAAGSPVVILPRPCRVFMVSRCPYSADEAVVFFDTPVDGGNVVSLSGFDPSTLGKIVFEEPVESLALTATATPGGILEILAVYGADVDKQASGGGGTGSEVEIVGPLSGGNVACDVTSLATVTGTSSYANLPAFRVSQFGRIGGSIAAAAWDQPNVGPIGAGAVVLALAASAARNGAFMNASAATVSNLRRTNVAANAGIALPPWAGSAPMFIPGGDEWYCYNGGGAGLYVILAGIQES